MGEGKEARPGAFLHIILVRVFTSTFRRAVLVKGGGGLYRIAAFWMNPLSTRKI